MSSLASCTDLIAIVIKKAPHLLYIILCLSHHKPTHKFYFPHQVITYFTGRVFDPIEAERGRFAFAGEYLKGDASLLISHLSLTDSGEYSCKVKAGAQYHWSTISLIVQGKWQTALRFNRKKITAWRLMRTLYNWRCWKPSKLFALQLSINVMQHTILPWKSKVCLFESSEQCFHLWSSPPLILYW